MPSTYPTSLDTTTTLSTAVNGLQTTLNGDHTSGATTITVASTSGAAAAGYVWLDSEAVKYAGITPTTLTGCTRGADGTAQASHSNGAVVKFGLVADHHNALVSAVIAAQTKLGTNTNGATATSIDGNQIAAATIGNLQVVDSSVLFRKLKLENNITQASAFSIPGAVALTATVWANWGNSLTITPAVASTLFIWYYANWFYGAAPGNQWARINVDGAVSGHSTVATVGALNLNTLLSGFDVVTVAAGARVLQVQVKVDTNNSNTGAQGLGIFVLAIPST